MRNSIGIPGWLRGAAAAASAALAVSAGAASRQVVPLSFEDAFDVDVFLGATGLGQAEPPVVLSPDGRQLAYVLCDGRRRAAMSMSGEEIRRIAAARGAAGAQARGCDVWVSSVLGGGARSVNNEIGESLRDNWAPAWSPDGRQLAFYSARGTQVRLWVWDTRRAGRAVSEAQIHAADISQPPLWLPDAKHVVARIRSADWGLPGPPAEKPGDALRVKDSSVVVLRSGAEARDGAVRVPDAPPLKLLADLAVIALDGGAVRRVVQDAYTESAWLSPDGAQLLYSLWRPSPSDNRLVSPCDFAVVDLRSGASRRVAADVWQATWRPRAAAWSPDGRRIAYLAAQPDASLPESRASEAALAVPGDLYVASVQRGVAEKLAPVEQTSGFQGTPVWNRVSDALYVIGQGRIWRGSVADGRIAPLGMDENFEAAAIVKAGASAWSPRGELAVLGRDTRTQQHGIYMLRGGVWQGALIESKHYLSVPAVSAATGHVVYAAESAAQPPDLWTTTSRFTAPVRITRSNPHYARYVLGESRLIEYRSADGTPLQAALLLPAGYKQGKRYPMLVFVYASRMGSRQVNYFGLEKGGQFMMQLLATRGYAVLFPDVPVHVSAPIQDLMNSVMPAIDRAVALGIADPDRLAVSGQSNGGYSALALIAHSTRFKAAVVNAGMGDLTAMYGALREDGSAVWQDWLEVQGGAMGVPPWEDPQRYVENSPIYRLDRIVTPLLMQAGAEDKYIVPYSDQVFAGLKRLGKDVTYLRYAGEYHLLLERRNILDYWSRVLPFLEARSQQEQSDAME